MTPYDDHKKFEAFARADDEGRATADLTLERDLPAVVARLEQLLAKATPGPWWLPPEGLCDARHVFAKGLGTEDYVLANCKASMTFVDASSREIDRANAALITEAVNALPDLLAALRTTQAENERLAGAISWIEPPFVDASTPADELRKRVGLAVTDANRTGSLLK